MIKIGDLAKITGYSVTTVSKALNNYTDISEKARKIIVEKANELGYIPNAQARGLVMKRSFTFGVMLDEFLNLGLEHPFFSGIVQSFRVAVESNGLDLVFISNQVGNSSIETYLDHCRQRNVDGVFILCSNPGDKGIMELINSHIPTVVFDMKVEETHSVVSDHYQGAYDAVMYLYGLGHRKIAHISGSDVTFAGYLRKRAYMDALEHCQIEVREDYIVNGGYFDLKYGKKAMETLISYEDRPTAVFAAGDMMALGAIQACYEHNIRIPEEISIIGFDNVKLLNWITPSLTTVAQDVKSIGESCCEILMEAVSNKTMEKQHRIIKTFIVERNSCISIDRT